jgi:hypothetical protein
MRCLKASDLHGKARIRGSWNRDFRSWTIKNEDEAQEGKIGSFSGKMRYENAALRGFVF